MPRKSVVILLLALLLSSATAALLWRERDASVQPASASVPFRLIDQDGHARSDEDFRGRFVLLYFGYSDCPDACPTTLLRIAGALDKLGPKSASVVPIFVTIDPARDKPSVLKPYLAEFGQSFVGLTGTPSAIGKVAHAYGVYFAKHPLAGGNYSMDHSSTIYLLDAQGQFLKTYDGDIGAAALADDLKKVM
ncbi:MAG TPA: SCO family protein [Rhizomicrobium sp.]|nr:SCO family protein [Rhizomicrobium sp.]